MSKKCRVCGNEIADGVVFCQRCGKPVDYSGVMNTNTNINRAENKYSAMAIITLILGIFSLALFWLPLLGFVLEISAIIIGKLEISNKRNEKSTKMAKIGFALGIIALALGIILAIIGLVGAAYAAGYNTPWYERIFS